MAFILPNGKSIDTQTVEMAMEDSDLSHSYFLNTQTGEVVYFSDYDDFTDEREKLLEEIDGSDDYVQVEPISSHESYQWMADFIDEIVAPKDERMAEKLSIAIQGRGAFRRFKDVLHSGGDKWVQTWYQWKDEHLHEEMKRWFESLPLTIIEEAGEKRG